ncbi:hypothetical protein GCM10007390_14340 [Persicitalea jodogahamensis]|uniref:Uncharacterized protein n=1 Tax=Persicitalea jodogahamensis TaxID=402147 RepID=A0A8J3D146_9BACT|nr:hypothetical protein GCM10007390_14340 [Persicitalea jodogahamensis]
MKVKDQGKNQQKKPELPRRQQGEEEVPSLAAIDEQHGQTQKNEPTQGVEEKCRSTEKRHKAKVGVIGDSTFENRQLLLLCRRISGLRYLKTYFFLKNPITFE